MNHLDRNEPSPRTRRSAQRGMSMVEITVSVSLLAFALLGMATSIMRSTDLRESSVGEFDAHERLVAILQDLRDKTPSEVDLLLKNEANGIPHGYGSDVEIVVLSDGAGSTSVDQGDPLLESGSGEEKIDVSSPTTLESSQSFVESDDDAGSYTSGTTCTCDRDSDAYAMCGCTCGAGSGGTTDPGTGGGSTSSSTSEVLMVRVTIQYQAANGSDREISGETLITY